MARLTALRRGLGGSGHVDPALAATVTSALL